ncbi:hypothetical protein EJ08DRAFT_732298 [Tothia fuscella]|uniref:Uncharacterized protein n=1 Tax=Tothia fuscella TaxID=1048955 RepID=A0A9P4U0K1_9PEZI|nr:hypothetical protein EJ08DRAFT_732298 [Tothia fuscella]
MSILPHKILRRRQPDNKYAAFRPTGTVLDIPEIRNTVYIELFACLQPSTVNRCTSLGPGPLLKQNRGEADMILVSAFPSNNHLPQCTLLQDNRRAYRDILHMCATSKAIRQELLSLYIQSLETVELHVGMIPDWISFLSKKPMVIKHIRHVLIKQDEASHGISDNDKSTVREILLITYVLSYVAAKVLRKRTYEVLQELDKKLFPRHRVGRPATHNRWHSSMVTLSGVLRCTKKYTNEECVAKVQWTSLHGVESAFTLHYKGSVVSHPVQI